MKLKKISKAWNKYNLNIGDKFNHLTIIEKNINDYKRQSTWKCKCDCNEIVFVSSYELIKGIRKQCLKCFRKSLILPDKMSIKNQLYSNYKNRALEQGLIFELSLEQFIELILGDCHYCGGRPSNISKKGKEILIYNGVDKKDNTIGYTKDNAVSCCKICNRGKNTISYKEWQDWLDRLATYRNKL